MKRAVGIVLLSSLVWVVPVGASDFDIHLSWDRNADVDHVEVQPGDTLEVFVRIDTTDFTLHLALDSVVFGLWSNYPLIHLDTKSFNDAFTVSWDQQTEHGEVSWTTDECDVRVADATEVVSRHVFLVGTSPESRHGYIVTTFSPGFDDPLLYIWDHEDCSGGLCCYVATPGILHLDVSVPIEGAAWGAVKSLYRVP